MINLNQEWRKPKNHSPIVIFGAGSIVNDAHLPAYKKAGFRVRQFKQTGDTKERIREKP